MRLKKCFVVQGEPTHFIILKIRIIYIQFFIFFSRFFTFFNLLNKDMFVLRSAWTILSLRFFFSFFFAVSSGNHFIFIKVLIFQLKISTLINIKRLKISVNHPSIFQNSYNKHPHFGSLQPRITLCIHGFRIQKYSINI